MIAFFSFTLALLLAAFLVPVAAHWAGQLKLLDQPSARKLHDAPVPRVGGIAIVTGTLASVILWLPMHPHVTGFVVGGAVVAAFGLLDDRLSLDYKTKFAAQVAGALIVVLLGDVQIRGLPFVYGVECPSWIGIPLTVLVIVAITNAVNLSDGMDGLAGGIVLLAAAAFGYLAYLAEDRVTALVAICLIGAVLGFLRYNTFPARVFMGDSGSQFLGFSAAVLGIVLVEQSDTAVSPIVPVLILGIPILDTVYVMGKRLAAGLSPFRADRQHLHHRLFDLGMGQYEVVLVIYGTQCALIVAGLWLRYASDALLLGVYAAFCALFVGGLHYLQSAGRASRIVERFSIGTRFVEFLRASRILSESARRLIVFGVPISFVLAGLLVTSVPADIRWTSLLLGAVLLPTLFIRRIAFLTVERFVAFSLALILSYLIELTPVPEALVWGWRAWCVLAAVAVAVWLRLGGRSVFQINTLDFLIVVAVAVVPNIPGVRETGLGPVVMESLVLLYACELIISERPRSWDPLRISLLAALALVGVGPW